MTMTWDIFISHASEDKKEVVRPLAKELKKLGLSVWYDELTLTIGDSLRRKIDYGLSKSKYGVVVLSRNFFSKEWPQKELDALVAREDHGKKVILPVWHQLTKEDVIKYSPLIADKLAASTFRGIPAVAKEILLACESRNPETSLAHEDTSPELIEDMRHHGIWHHHDYSDAKGSTWAAIASEAGRLNYNYELIIFFLNTKNRNNGWYVKEYIKNYRPVPIPSMIDFIEILGVRRDNIERVIKTGNIKLEWTWPSSWGKVPWTGPIIHDHYDKRPKKYYMEEAKNEYRQTMISIEQYKLILLNKTK